MMKRFEIIEKMTGMVDLTDVGTRMVEAVQRVVDEMMEQTIGNTDNDEELEAFWDAFWMAMAQGNSRKAKEDAEVLAVLKTRTANNALEVARDTEFWHSDEDRGEELRQEFLGVIDKCWDGEGDKKDWEWLADETAM